MDIKYLPAEWAEQEFVAVIFPHSKTDWRSMLIEATKCFAEIVKQIAVRQRVVVILDDLLWWQCCAESYNLEKNDNITCVVLDKNTKPNTNDTWARDTLGITVFENGKPILLDFSFNGWGLKFPANLDNLITSKVFDKYKETLFENYNYRSCLNFILEGGSIESDGNGTILTTKKCLLSENRNYFSEAKIEQTFSEYFGTKRVLWLKNGSIAGDDTDSHIDTLARFCNENTIAYVKCENKNDEHFAELQAMESELKSFLTADGLPYSLVPLPMADKVIFDGVRLPATYANFLIINEAVLLPTYNSPKDKIAAETLQKVFPDRKIVQIDCLPLIKQRGSLHCVTMQFPKLDERHE
ncbi:MAG: agmatine deiminase family protein [Prevotellaceae bacterium]|jgi:agmatine/peptidylarginine deiminase|nr:agmatine deiminase family protein [Prevotellaceae bacterium]